MSRIKTDSRGIQRSITAWVDFDVSDRLEVLAKKFKISKSQLIANIITANLPEIEKMENFGFFTAAVIWQDLKVQLKAWVETAELAPHEVGSCSLD